VPRGCWRRRATLPAATPGGRHSPNRHKTLPHNSGPAVYDGWVAGRAFPTSGRRDGRVPPGAFRRALTRHPLRSTPPAPDQRHPPNHHKTLPRSNGPAVCDGWAADRARSAGLSLATPCARRPWRWTSGIRRTVSKCSPAATGQQFVTDGRPTGSGRRDGRVPAGAFGRAGGGPGAFRQALTRHPLRSTTLAPDQRHPPNRHKTLPHSNGPAVCDGLAGGATGEFRRAHRGRTS
jgi:hypothetical protein